MRSRTVVSGVDDAGDLGDSISQDPLDPLPDRDLGEATSLTASLHANPRTALCDVDEAHSSTVSRDGGVHLVVDDLTPALGEIAETRRRGGRPRPPDSHARHLWHGRTEQRFDL